MVAGGFGWSAGDIATAIRLVVKISKAFKATGGASARYQDALAFLRSLKVTLDHLAQHASRNGSDAYSGDITEQLESITPHWEAFESFLGHFERSLGATTSRLKIAKAPRIVQYTLQDLSGEVERLKAAIAQPLQVINTLLSLQLIHETKLVPQKPFTQAQCVQLVDAINLAGIPGALNRRLDLIQQSHEHTATDISAKLAARIDALAASQCSLRKHESGIHTAVGLRVDTSLASDQDGPSEGSASDSEGLRQYRLLVEDQHWSVIQLFRALSQQLEELKSVTASRDTLGVCDGHRREDPPRRAPTSPLVKTAATSLITALTTSITTGIVVGHIEGGSSTASALHNTDSTSITLGSSAQETISPTPNQLTQVNEVSCSDSHDPQEEAHMSPESAKQETTTPQPPSAHRTAIPHHGPDAKDLRRAPITSEQVTMFGDGVRYLGMPCEQLVVCMQPASSHTEKSGRPEALPRSTTVTTRSAKGSRVPECAPIPSHERSGFFVPGRVFMTLWSALAQETCLGSHSIAEVPYIDADIAEQLRGLELRRFVVLRNEGPYSLCAPVYLGITFNRTRSMRAGPYELPIAMIDQEAEVADRDADLALTVVPTLESGIARVPKHSLLRLREVCMIGHTVRVIDIGQVAIDELSLLQQLWHDANHTSKLPWLVEDSALKS